MPGDSPDRGGFGRGGHFIAAVTGSGNSEYLIRWTEATSRRLGAAWTALHVRVPGQDEDASSLERNLSLARNLGAEVSTVADGDVPGCLVRYARRKGATALIIGKAGDEKDPFRGPRSLMEEILRESGDLDVIILRGKTPVPPGKRPSPPGPGRVSVRELFYAAGALAAVTSLGLLGQPVLGYRSVSILYLLAIIILPFFCGRLAVFAGAAASALLWNFLFIPPRMTFSIGSLEDVLMFTAFFLAAFVGGFLTTRLKEKESTLSLQERRMAFLYGFTRAVSGVRGAEDVARFAEDYLERHLRLRASIRLGIDGRDLRAAVEHEGAEAAPGFRADLAERSFRTGECVADGEDRLYLPLGSQGSMLGVLFVTGNGEREIHGELRELLAALAGNLVLALEREALSAENERNKMASETARLSRILLHHVSHELRTPLTTIKGSVSGLLEGDTAEDPRLRRELLSETMIAANRLNMVVEDLLVMSRLESGRLSPHPELVYVGELLGAARQTLGVELGERTIVLEEASRDSEIEADPVLMVQVFRNILRNFAAYTKPGARLTVETESDTDSAAVRFSDNGPGVPDREMGHLFDTFFRGSRSSARPGTGLGLSICRGIVEVQGGTVQAARSVEGGLSITMRLPMRGKP